MELAWHEALENKKLEKWGQFTNPSYRESWVSTDKGTLCTLKACVKKFNEGSGDGKQNQGYGIRRLFMDTSHYTDYVEFQIPNSSSSTNSGYALILLTYKLFSWSTS